MVPVLLLCAACRGQKATKVSDIDLEKMKRIAAQVQLIQLQAQQTAAPLMAEYQDIQKKACEGNALKVEECIIDEKTGAVSKKAPPPPPVKN